MHWNDWHLGWMGLWWILIIAGIVVATWFAVAASRRRESRDSPEQVVKRRYANGEIDRDTYERMLGDLRK